MRKFSSLLLMLLLCSVWVFAQTRTVTGTVRDAQGNPVPYANVTEIGTRNGVQADANGNYSIKVGSNARLQFTASGYTATESADGGNIVLTRNDAQLTEVVVTTAQGLRRDKRSLGYSAPTINN